MCRSKHVQPSINFGIINSITKLHLVGISTESSTMQGSMNIKYCSPTLLFSLDDIHPLTLHIHGHVPKFLSSVILVHPANIPEFILFIYSNLFPYIPFRYIPREWKESHSLHILRHLQSDTTNSRLERVHKNHSYNLHNLTLCTEY